MYRGCSKISIDSKGRLAVPSRYRALILEQAQNNLVITLNPLDRSLYLYPLPEWEIIEDKLAAFKIPSLIFCSFKHDTVSFVKSYKP